MVRDNLSLWSSPEWYADASAWILAAVRAAGRRPTGPVEQPRTRIWSTQLTLDTDRGRVWFKENTPPNRFEAALVAALHRTAPGCVLPPLAVDADRGRLLCPDGGPTLREAGVDHPDTWAVLLAEWSVVQRQLAAHEAAVLATGVPALPVDTLVEATLAYIEDGRRRRDDDQLHLSSEDADTARSGIAHLRAAVEELAALGLPMSLDHNDLHTGNAFVRAEGPCAFLDLGDAVWGHPLASLGLPVRIMTRDWGCGPGDPRVRRVVDAALEPWSDLASGAQLRGAVQAARRVSCLHRHVSWHRVLDAVPPAPGALDYGSEHLLAATAPAGA